MSGYSRAAQVKGKMIAACFLLAVLLRGGMASAEMNRTATERTAKAPSSAENSAIAASLLASGMFCRLVL